MGNLFDDPERKLRKYLQGGKIEQSGEWHVEYDKDGQLTEKYNGSGKWWDTKRERCLYEWNQNGTLKAAQSPQRTNWVELIYDKVLDGVENQGSHFNIRPIENTRTGKLAGILEHYND